MLSSLALVFSVISCGDAPPVTAPERPNTPTTPTTEPRATVYQLVKLPSIKYWLFENGDFDLRYGGYPPYHGQFTRTDSTVTLVFWSSRPYWCSEAWCEKALAKAQLRSDTLFVEYDNATTWLLCNDMMDFDVCDTRSAKFVRSR
jgi:hypothetical protein